MRIRGDIILHFWLPVAGLWLFAANSAQKLVRVHLGTDVDSVNYIFTRQLPAHRGTIYDVTGSDCPLAKSIPVWEYHLDPVSMTNRVVRRPHEPPRPPKAIVRTIAKSLGLEYSKVLEMSMNSKKRYQFLAVSSDPDVHRTLTDSTLVAGIAVDERQVRQYPHGRMLSHVLGAVNSEHTGSAGIELRYDSVMKGLPGEIKGLKDAKGHELYDRRQVSVDPVAGADVYLTVDHNLQYEAERKLAAGVKEFGAGSGWCIVMDARTGAVMAMASLPDCNPSAFGSASESAKLNRAVAFTFEPGSVMKVITVASAIDAGFVRPDTVYRTNRDDPAYYRLPGDGHHAWDPTMTVRNAIVKSSNIVVGKLGYDFQPKRLYAHFRKFGLGERTGIELPGEECGILPDPNRKMWDKASWSRAAIGQFVAITGIQLASAYQAIANDGMRMKPYIVDRVVASDGKVLFRNVPTPAGRAVSAKTARTMRDIMLGVATRDGTARRAAVRGYSVAGKTGTAEKHVPGIKGYAPGLYRASFCGIVPAGDPRLVVLVTLDFDERRPFHQGGNSAGPVFRDITTTALRYLAIPPDRPEELEDEDDGA